MSWTLIALLFAWLAIREISGSRVPRAGYSRTKPVYKPYLLACILLALFSAWQPLKYWRFERHLALIASQLADQHPATMHCNGLLDTMLDQAMFASGHANLETGEIAFQHGWCGTLMDYLAHPERASEKELFSLHMLTHESMHVRGEANEARAECQAIQRDYRAAKLLGVPDAIARKNALDYYLNSYQSRKEQGWFSAQYYSDQCAPGKAMDEQLSDSSWTAL